MEEKIRISILLEIYGKLLTPKQYEFMDYYYNQDLSLSEIADNNDITRQAVNTILIKSKKKLEEYEELLGVRKKEETIIQDIKKIEGTKLTQEQKKVLNNIKEKLDF